jgi:hypothetical protein
MASSSLYKNEGACLEDGMMKKQLTPFLALSLIAFIAACSSDKPVTPLALDYNSLGKINLAVANIQVTDHSLPVMQGVPESALRPTIAEAAHHWINDRLSAAGSSGQAIVIIKQADFSVVPMPTKGDWFTREQAVKYMANIAVDIEINGEGGTAVASAEAHRQVSLPSDPNSSERQKAYNDALQGLMTDFNNNMEQNIHAYMQGFVAGASSAVVAPSMPMASTMPSSGVPSSAMSSPAMPETALMPSTAVISR